jgi:hypothetical protein
MVNLEFHKPSTWSKGQKVGLIGVIALIIGPFLPYIVYEYEFGDQTVTNNYSYLIFEGWGLYMLFPFLCALIFFILLYLKVDIFMQKDSKTTNLKPFVTMALGFWFFLVHISEAARFTQYATYARRYPGIGLMLIIGGFFLCGLAGFLEWRRPSTMVPQVAPKKDIVREGVASVPPQPAVERITVVSPQDPIEKQIVQKEPIKPKPLYPASSGNSRSYADEYRIQSRSMQPVTKEQKTLLSWAKRLDRHKDIYEKCIKCEKYGFIEVKDTGLSLTFTCPNCNEKFTLKK